MKINAYVEHSENQNKDVVKRGSMRLRLTTILLGLLFIVPLKANAVNTFIVVTSTAPVSVGQTLLSQISNQFNASVMANPLAANTYQIRLFDLNPNYVTSPAVVTLNDLANKLTAISTYTYVTGFASGELYERFNNAGSIGYFMGLCNNATNFYVMPGDSMTWTTSIDSTTCNNVLGFMDNWIINQTSGIAVVPNPPPGF